VPQRGQLLLVKIPIIRHLRRDHRDLLLLQLALARILNEQGRAQLGRSWGGAESPDCSGFTVAQLQSLDFSRMDLTEFYAEIAPTLPDVGHCAAGPAARQQLLRAVNEI
jgi:conjugal transfer mating pair stabilization protein TraN